MSKVVPIMTKHGVNVTLSGANPMDFNVGNCTFPYPPLDQNPWYPDWKDLKPTGPMILDWRPPVISNLGDNMAKEREKLAQIKGLIEGARLSESTDKVDALLDKILQVIEEHHEQRTS